MATEETVSTIAKALGESDEVPLFQITGVVRVLGEETAQKLLTETQDIEKKGGMMLPDNSRKRTAGGVFFFLARQQLSQADKLAIFRPPKEPKAPQSSPGSEANRFPAGESSTLRRPVRRRRALRALASCLRSCRWHGRASSPYSCRKLR